MLLSPAEWQALRISLQVSLVAVALGLLPAIAIAWLLARRAFPGRFLVQTLVNLPLVIPPVVTGYLLLIALGTHGWLGSRLHAWLGIRLVFDWKGAAIASGVVAFPLMVRAIQVGIESVDPRFEQAHRTLGHGALSTLRRVTLPLCRHAVIAGAVLAFARALGEFGATIMIAGNIPGQTRTIPLAIYTALESPGGDQQAWRLVGISIILAAGALAASELMLARARRRLAP
ncbi:MAG: molybdate ABC transporter permease subunit [Phycisphaeraceae bacterium]|nr:molybdate ABC transporter permease subunit [Phycisphaeraceae bacterium]